MGEDSEKIAGIIPAYPVFAPLDLGMRGALAPLTDNHPDGACEFLFACMFLFRHKYRYRISKLREGCFVLAGEEPEGAASGRTGSFFSLPGVLAPLDRLGPLIRQFGMWKTITASQHKAAAAFLTEAGFTVEESRNNFDYLYSRVELAELRGKKFHKKKNLVNAFLTDCTPQVCPLTPERAADARSVLDTWARIKGLDADYEQCAEALDNSAALGLDGVMVYADSKPVAFSLGEPMRGGTMYCVHFEKGIDTYRGIFQYVNQTAARQMPPEVTEINREQDTGDEGLRQAKMTYRPTGFTVKYIAYE